MSCLSTSWVTRKLPINRQSELLQQLNQIVRATEQFRRAEAANKLVCLPTGDGMALVFFTSPDAPVRCALEISEAVGQALPPAGENGERDPRPASCGWGLTAVRSMPFRM